MRSAEKSLMTWVSAWDRMSQSERTHAAVRESEDKARQPLLQDDKNILFGKFQYLKRCRNELRTGKQDNLVRTGKFGCQLFWLHWQTAMSDTATAKVEKSDKEGWRLAAAGNNQKAPSLPNLQLQNSFSALAEGEKKKPLPWVLSELAKSEPSVSTERKQK
ncbi:hypothetical protein Anapl_07180 [Anas platyrhynchos]|uniref:Uncharacterized protein n=1 Tax=Anas platyrhynchos TaxID=8839 RepID=R0LCX3_ANAPL|nr:hypothetical protein Anapl_07180 [Anas platyrhynchos]